MARVLVLGGGSAGCVLAARLSADERRGVLLVEAGPDYPGVVDLPADIADESMPATSHDWGFVSDPDEFGHSVPLPRGRLGWPRIPHPSPRLALRPALRRPVQEPQGRAAWGPALPPLPRVSKLKRGAERIEHDSRAGRDLCRG